MTADPTFKPPPLADLLRLLHARGCWLHAWYPLADGRFECRITNGSLGLYGWGVDPDPLVALHKAMVRAELIHLGESTPS